MKKRKIIYFTGSRAEFGLMLSTLKEIQKSEKLDLSLIVTGTHLSNVHEYSIDEIEKHGFKIEATIPIVEGDESTKLGMAISTGKCLAEAAKVLAEAQPDILLVEADRFEMLAGAIAGAFLNIPVAHTSGGSISGSIDNSIRQAITKFAHIHLPGSKEAAERIIRMGEEPWRVHLVGKPINKNFASKEEVEAHLNIKLEPDAILVLQHPVTLQEDKAGEQMKDTLDAVIDLGKQTVIIYPNNDPGSDKMIEEINKAKYSSNITVFKNLQSSIFSGLLNNISVIVGNSSCGLVEAPFFDLPCVNIGIRQEGRERGGNVIDVEQDKIKIKESMLFAMSRKFKEKVKRMRKPFDYEGAEKQICKILENIKINERLLSKMMTY